MTDENVRLWEQLYPEGLRHKIDYHACDVLKIWRDRVKSEPNTVVLNYYKQNFTTLELDNLSDAFAVALRESGVAYSDRVGIHLQNTPHFIIALLALWKLGAVALLLNPMYFGRELIHIIRDAEPVGIITNVDCYEQIASDTQNLTVHWIWTVDPDDFLLGKREIQVTNGTSNESRPKTFIYLINQYLGRTPDLVDIRTTDIALLTYTSGTTGPAKGAMNTHGNVLAVISSLSKFLGITQDDVIYALAPLFHITGVIALGVMAILQASKLVMTGRFNASSALEAIRREGVTFTTGSITAFIAMMNEPNATRDHFKSIKTLYSGGAPVPASVVEQFEAKFGHYIHNAYGMTETTNGVIAVPRGRRAPVDPKSGTLSVGVPLPGLEVTIERRPTSSADSISTIGELVMSGPQIVPGYWRNPEATKRTMPGGALHSGDAAAMDGEGWIYIVDRIKDQINVSGYKVWPREVEDAIYRFPGVLEVGVIGVPDAYQGESVAAFIAPKPGVHINCDELRRFLKTELAAYKVPRYLRLVVTLPKTLTGKIQRSKLRESFDQI